MTRFSVTCTLGLCAILVSGLAWATDPIHQNCSNVALGQSVYEADYDNFTQCTSRMDTDARIMEWGIGNLTTSIVINPALYKLDGVVLINTTIDEIATFNGKNFDPDLPEGSNDTVFAALAPRIDGDDSAIYYEGVITKYPTTISGIEYYDQLRMGNSGQVFATDVDTNGTRALMIPLRTPEEYSSFTEAIDSKSGPAQSTGTGYLSNARSMWRCQRSLEDVPFAACAPPVSVSDLAEQFTTLFVSIDYCTYIPIWRLSTKSFQEVVPGAVEISFKVVLEDSGIAQQSYSIEMLMLENGVLQNGDVKPKRQPCTRDVAVFPNFFNPDNNQYHRLVYDDHSLLSDVFLTTFPGLSHKTYDMIEALEHDDETFMFMFSYKGPHTTNLVHLDRPGWPQVNEARIRILAEPCCGGGGGFVE